MTDEYRFLDAQMVEKPDEVAGQVLHVIGFDRLGTWRQAIAALVGRDDPAARRSERSDLVSPRERQLREPVTKDDRNPLAWASLVVGHADAVHLGELRRGERGGLPKGVRHERSISRNCYVIGDKLLRPRQPGKRHFRFP